ncbi:PAS domain S-box protein [Natronobacterium lacisalsi]|uniref:PAS domain S-box protein n=1 Tax=Natronobacterium lacisalsi TaxID=229731 RepID=UPI001EE7617C|nr:PAS domain S-box protein [Halobiforma lacisalsi]
MGGGSVETAVRRDGAMDPVTVLVAAADPDRGRSVKGRLERAEESLTATVETGEGALAGIDSRGVDCVLCTERWVAAADNGVRGDLEHILERDADRMTPPILCLGDGDTVSPRAALEAGLTDYVLEPSGGDPESPGADRNALLARRVRNAGERHRAERAATEYRSIFEALPDAVVVHDAAGNYSHANRRATELLGYDRERLLEETTVADVETELGPDDLESELRRIDPGDALTLEGRNRRADGTEVPVRVSVRRSEADDDRYIGVVRDVTELRDRERELERSLDLLEKTEELADAGGWELDLRTDDLRWTNGTRRIHAVDDEFEPTLERAIEFYHPDDRDRIDATIRAAITEGTSFDETARILTADGTTKRLRLRGEAYCEDGRTVQVRGAIWDVTERHRQRQEIRASNAKLEALATAFPDVALVLDEEGRYLEVYASEESEARLIDAPEAMVGEPVEDILPRRQAETIREGVERAVETGATQTVEYRLEVPAGNRWFEGRIAPVGDRIGGSRAVVLVARDVTERKETAAELRQREAHLEQAQAVANIGSWHMDVPSDQIYWSDEVYEIFGLEREDGPIDHDRFMAHIHPDDRTFVDREWEAAKRGDTYDVEHRIVTADGGTKWVRQKAELTFDDGQPVSAVGVVQDVTDRKEYERRLESQNERLEVFNRVIRHDLRNRMNVIEGYASMLEDRVDDENSFASRIRIAAEELLSVGEEIHRANRLVTDPSHDRRPVDLRAALESALDSLRERYEEFGCTMTAPESAWVRGADGIEVALENVLENAIEHNDAARPRIEIDVDVDPNADADGNGKNDTDRDDAIEVTIADNGPGIPKSERELLTGRKERSQLEHTSGLGLWIATWVVSSLDGELELAEREGEQRGTVVRIRLPRTERRSAGGSPSDPDHEFGSGSKPTTNSTGNTNANAGIEPGPARPSRDG